MDDKQRRRKRIQINQKFKKEETAYIQHRRDFNQAVRDGTLHLYNEALRFFWKFRKFARLAKRHPSEAISKAREHPKFVGLRKGRVWKRMTNREGVKRFATGPDSMWANATSEEIYQIAIKAEEYRSEFEEIHQELFTRLHELQGKQLVWSLHPRDYGESKYHLWAASSDLSNRWLTEVIVPIVKEHFPHIRPNLNHEYWRWREF